MQKGDPKADESVSFYESTSADVVALGEATLQTSWIGAQKESITMLGDAVSSFWRLLRRVTKTLFETLVKSGETEKRFSMILMYGCNFREAKDMPAAQQGAERQQLCVRCHILYKSMLRGRESSSRVAAKMKETKRKGRNAGRGCKPSGEGL